MLQKLLQHLQVLPSNWAFVAVGNNKAPIGNNWQKTSLTKQSFEVAAKVGHFQELEVKTKDSGTIHPPVSWLHAIGVLCGTPSGGLLFVDHDGESCDKLIEELSGQPAIAALPKTPTVTSGRPGRYQAIYRIPEQYWGAVTTKKINTGVIGTDGKPEQLEFRWDGCQSVVAGHHPVTGAYFWLPELSPADCEVAEAPHWMIEQLLRKASSNSSCATGLKSQSTVQTWTEEDWALSYLAAIPPSEDYDAWIKVGMALHSVSKDLLTEWDSWSRGATNYEAGACEKHWKSFKSDDGIGIGSLGLLAKQSDWQLPLNWIESNRCLQSSTDSTVSNQSKSSYTKPSTEDEDFEEQAQEIQNLVGLTEETAPIQQLLSPRLLIALKNISTRFNVPLEAFVGVLLPIASSLLKVDTRIEIDAATNFRPPPILWMGLVGESGTTKSPIIDKLLEPLARLQVEADTAYQLDFDDYKDELETWQTLDKEKRGAKPAAPIQREYFFQDATFEALSDCLSKQPNRGVVVAVDELAGLFNGFNQYRSHGRGNDLQKWLSLYDGRPIKINRKTGNRISLPQTLVSLTGTIQPCVLQKHMENLNEVDGFWPRYFWIRVPLTKMPPPGEGSVFDLLGLLRGLYQGLEHLDSKIYQLDKRGRDIWRDWHCWCEEQKVNEPHPALRSVYPKSKERAARICLIAHCINAVIEGSVPDVFIKSELLEAAIAFTKWLIGQTRLIYADAGVTTWQESPKIARFVERFKGTGSIKTRQVIHWFSSREKPNAETARTFMKQVVDLGYAISNGKTGREFQIRIKDDCANTGNNQPTLPYERDIYPSNTDGNKAVTSSDISSEVTNNETFENGNKFAKQHNNLSSSVTTGVVSLELADEGNFSKAQENLLPEVMAYVTNPEASTTKDSEAYCYQVTEFQHQSEGRTVWFGNEIDQAAKKSQVLSPELKQPKVKSHECTIMHSSKSNEWYTLPEWIDKARELMGEITLDPASNDEAQGWIKATHYYTKEQDGMKLPWFGCVWLNPPYGNRNREAGVYGSTAWTLKAIAEYEAGNITQAVLWLRAGGNKGIQALEDKGYPRVVLGRVSHAPPGANGKPQKGAGHDTVVYYLGPHVERFKELFGREV